MKNLIDQNKSKEENEREFSKYFSEVMKSLGESMIERNEGVSLIYINVKSKMYSIDTKIEVYATPYTDASEKEEEERHTVETNLMTSHLYSDLF